MQGKKGGNLEHKNYTLLNHGINFFLSFNLDDFFLEYLEFSFVLEKFIIFTNYTTVYALRKKFFLTNSF